MDIQHECMKHSKQCGIIAVKLMFFFCLTLICISALNLYYWIAVVLLVFFLGVGFVGFLFGWFLVVVFLRMGRENWGRGSFLLW